MATSKIELPDKVHQRIINSLSNEKDAASIARCALVCHAWLDFSRSKLYRVVELRNLRHWMCFEQLIATAHTYVESHLEKIEELRIKPDILGTSYSWKDAWTYRIITQYAEHFSRVRSIVLHGVNGWWPKRTIVVPNFSRMTALELSFCTFQNIHLLHSLIIEFPELSELTLQKLNLSVGIAPAQGLDGGQALTSLRLIDFEKHILLTVSRWLADSRFVRDLEHLEWAPVAAQDKFDKTWETLTDSINEDALKSLCKHMPDPIRGGAYHFLLSHFCSLSYGHINVTGGLARFRSLRTLELHFATVHVQNHLVSLKKMLHTVSNGAHLEQLGIRLENDRNFGLSSDDVFKQTEYLKDIGDVLTRERFSSLRLFVISWTLHVYAEPLDEQLEDEELLIPVLPPTTRNLKHVERMHRIIQKSLPQLVKRDLLDVQLDIHWLDPLNVQDRGKLQNSASMPEMG